MMKGYKMTAFLLGIVLGIINFIGAMLCGVGLIVTMPSEKDLQNNEVGPLIRKFLQGRDGVDVTDRMRILRLIENMTIGRNAVGYLTESLHGAGSPQAQRIQIARGMKLEDKKARARHLAGISERAK